MLYYGAREFEAYRPQALNGSEGWRTALRLLEARAGELGIEHVQPAGEGGLGWVFRAAQPALGRAVALKVGKSMRSIDLDAALRTQGMVTARLRHESIPQVHGAGTLGPEGPAYLMLEWIDGEPLDRWVHEQASCPPHRMVAIALAAAGALEHGHRRGVVHGNVQPANILVPRDPGRPAVLVDWSGHEAAGAVVPGSVEYLSPERSARKGCVATAEDDVWALAAILRRSLSKATWDRERVPLGLAAVLGRALAVAREGRITSAEALAGALRLCLSRARSAAAHGLLPRASSEGVV